jgi:UDP-GlcNAc3NAcA epimerase
VNRERSSAPRRRVLTVVGARPQFVKAAVVSRALAARGSGAEGGGIVEEILHTGQHYDRNMSDCFFDEMGIPEPAVNLRVGSSSHGEATGAMLAGVEREILARRPDLVLVYGDTNSTLAGALAAAKLHVPVAHVEAGLRSFNRRMPEEINRVLTDHCSDLLFCPSETARRQLAAEGIDRGVEVVGDVMYDAVLHYRQRASAPERQGFALATVHRAENTDDPGRLSGIMDVLAASPVPVLLALHPRTRKALAGFGISPGANVEVIEPLPYLSLLGHLEKCRFVITDSGGLQKEAYFMGRKCLTLRSETEWTELVDIGANRLLNPAQADPAEAYRWAFEPLTVSEKPYGDGHAAERIVGLLRSFLERPTEP